MRTLFASIHRRPIVCREIRSHQGKSMHLISRHSSRTCRIPPKCTCLLVQSTASLQRFAPGSDAAASQRIASAPRVRLTHQLLPRLCRQPSERGSAAASPCCDPITRATSTSVQEPSSHRSTYQGVDRKRSAIGRRWDRPRASTLQRSCGLWCRVRPRYRVRRRIRPLSIN